jgi:hypothetical protein
MLDLRDISDDVAEEILGHFAIAIATESERVIGIRNRYYRDDRLREILAAIANQQVALGCGRRVDLPHLFRVAIDAAIDEIVGRRGIPHNT